MVGHGALNGLAIGLGPFYFIKVPKSILRAHLTILMEVTDTFVFLTDWNVFQLDINNALLYGDLVADIYMNSDWAKCTATRKFVTGYAVYLGNYLVSWKTKLQIVLAKSSTEAEYTTMSKKIVEGVFKTVKIKYEDNVSDVFTKGLPAMDHKKFCDQLCLTDYVYLEMPYQANGSLVLGGSSQSADLQTLRRQA
ncbi:hypothetical protein Tco_0928174 [Tanacetum coccineum]